MEKVGDAPSDKICSICQRVFTEFGNNAQPVNAGRCCDECNNAVVIPARINMVWQRILLRQRVKEGQKR
jgi:hypothetical protein